MDNYNSTHKHRLLMHAQHFKHQLDNNQVGRTSLNRALRIKETSLFKACIPVSSGTFNIVQCLQVGWDSEGIIFKYLYSRVLAKASKGGCPPSFFIQPPSFPHPSLVSLNGMQGMSKCFDVLNHHHPFAEF